jgi:hypothetical protein
MRTLTTESRLPELRPLWIGRDRIASGLSEIKAPDLSKIGRPTDMDAAGNGNPAFEEADTGA